MPSTMTVKASRSVGGYTLIELAIVLMVTSLLVVSFISAYSIYKKNQVALATDLNSSMVVSALGNYLIQTGRYPCPARINAERGDADYGIATQCDPTEADYPNARLAPDPTPVPGTFVDGLWYETSLTQVDSDPSDVVVPVTPRVRRGSIPFRTLGLPEDRAEDGYGNRFQYAVTERLAVTSTYHRGHGGILVHNAVDQPYFSSGNTFLRPDSDVIPPTTIGNWTNPALDRWNTIAEAAIEDGSRTSHNINTLGILEVGLTDPVITPPAGTVTVRFRAAKIDGTGVLSGTGAAQNLTVSVMQGAVPIWTNAAVALTGAFVKYEFTFPTALVTNWNDLRLRFVLPASSGTRAGTISWAELEAPGSNTGYVDYFLFSSGKDRAGAYTRYGRIVQPCPAGQLDEKNCDTTAQAIYRVADLSEATGASAASHFDDYVKFNISVETPLWRLSGAGGNHIRDLLGVETTPGAKIAVGQAPDPTNDALLQVGGKVRARNSAAMVSEICDTATANCFEPEKLGTAHADFQCPGGAGGDYAIGFENGKIKCGNTPRAGCDPGQFMTGVALDGTPECVSVVGCPGKNLTLCAGTPQQTTYTLPTGVQGQVHTTPPAGFNYVENWVCGPSPNWQPASPTASSGVCNCAPVDEVYDVPCNTVTPGNWTGTVTMHHVHTCPADTDSVTEVSRACVCAPVTETNVDFAACGPGFTGSITYQRTWDCTTLTWSPWVVAPGGNNCTCNSNSETQGVACPPASTGTHTQQRDFVCPGGTWTGWYDTLNTCTCVDGTTETTPGSCPPNWSGAKTLKRTYTCATTSWSGWVTDTDTCSCTNTTENNVQDCSVTRGPAFIGDVFRHRNFTCPAGTWGSWIEDSNTCSCTAATESRTIGCTAPLAGTKDQERTYDCGAGTWGPWVDTVDNCVSVTYNWVPKTPAQGPYATGLANKAGNSCTLGPKAPCSALAGGGLGHWHYAECQCE